jgi:hypothetical protein
MTKRMDRNSFKSAPFAVLETVLLGEKSCVAKQGHKT